jgi:hypothetical protein
MMIGLGLTLGGLRRAFGACRSKAAVDDVGLTTEQVDKTAALDEGTPGAMTVDDSSAGVMQAPAQPAMTKGNVVTLSLATAQLCDEGRAMTAATHFQMMRLAKGNQGAMAALNDVWRHRTDADFMGVLLTLALHGFAGSAIWYGYSHWAKKDVNKFADAVKSKNPEMFAVMKDGHTR